MKHFNFKKKYVVILIILVFLVVFLLLLNGYKKYTSRDGYELYDENSINEILLDVGDKYNGLEINQYGEILIDGIVLASVRDLAMQEGDKYFEDIHQEGILVYPLSELSDYVYLQACHITCYNLLVNISTHDVENYTSEIVKTFQPGGVIKLQNGRYVVFVNSIEGITQGILIDTQVGKIYSSRRIFTKNEVLEHVYVNNQMQAIKFVSKEKERIVRLPEFFLAEDTL